MPLYKILELDDRGWDGWVRAAHETWTSLGDALDELGPEGWEMATTIYAPADGRPETQLPRAIIMIHPSLSRNEDIRRIVRKVENRLSEAKAELDDSTLPQNERLNANWRVREATDSLEKLQGEISEDRQA